LWKRIESVFHRANIIVLGDMKNPIRKVLIRLNILILMAVLLVYALAGFFLAPLVVRWYIPNYAEQKLHCRAHLQQVRVNPFLLTIEINDFRLEQNDGSPLLAFQRLFVDLEMSSLLHWAVVLRQLDLDKPDIRVVLEADGAINLGKLGTPSSSAEPAKSTTKPFPFIIQELTIDGGRLAFVDRHQKVPAELNLRRVGLHLKDLSSIRDHNGTYSLSAMTEQGESIRWEGNVFPSPFRSEGKLSFTAVKAASLWKFFRDNTNLEQPTGLITINSAYKLDVGKTPVQMTFDRLRLLVSDLSLKLLHEDKAFVKLKQVKVDAPHFDLAGKQLRVGRLLAEDGAVDVRVKESGDLNLQRIMRSSLQDKHAAGGPPSPDAQAAKTGAGTSRTTVADPPFKIEADAVDIKNVSVAVNDKSRMLPLEAGIAAVDLSFKAKVEAGSNRTKAALKDISSEVKSISIRSSKFPEPLLVVKKLTLAGGDCDLGARTLSISRIALDKGSLAVVRDPKGKIDWQQLFENKETQHEEAAENPAAPEASAWKVRIKSVEVEGFSSRFSDLTTHSDRPVVSLQGINGGISDFDGKTPMGFNLDFGVEQGGSARLSGTINPSIPAVEAKIKADGLSLTSLQPYIEPYVSLELKSAVVSAQGKLWYGIPGAAQKAAYEGDLSLNNLNLADSNSRKTYLSWDAVRIPKIKLTLQPDGLDIPEIKISKPVGELIIGQDGTLNLAKVIKDRQGGNKIPSPAAAKASKGRDVFPYHISSLRVDGGNMLFADMSLRPRFMSRIHDIKGNISNLSSDQNTWAKIRLNGYVNKYGTARIRSAIHPGDFRRSSDVNIVFRNLDMKTLSPYSGKFAGRLIESGKVSADLKYKLQNYKMTGDNKIVLENLVLGKHVDEPGAVDLPLDLAIALLQDADGRINIGLPISGDLNDPQFSIGPIVWKLFANLITKAVTSPFLALGHMFGGNFEHFDAVEFAPGSAELSPPEKEKLLKLAEALKDRPQLKLVIQGRYSPEVDGRRLKNWNILGRVAAGLGKKPAPDDRPHVIDFTDAKTQNVLEQLYKENVAKPSLTELEEGMKSGSIKPLISERLHKAIVNNVRENADTGGGLKLYKIIPGAKSPEQAALWAGELYSRLIASERISDDVFRRLAAHRALAIAEELEGDNHVPKGRMRIMDPEASSDEGHPSAKLSLEAR
jgi:uncharacterized protein involved in outer membrane biogenesis